METRMIPRIDFGHKSIWWRVDVKKIVFRLGKFHIWKWKTVGYYSRVGDAIYCAITKLED